jgi:hypothetical protein
MIRFAFVNILVLATTIAACFANDIESIGYEWSKGYSPYKYIRVFVENDGSGTCIYQTGGGENVTTHFYLDKIYLDSLIDDFNKLGPSAILPKEIGLCSDCGITRIFYTTLRDSIECFIDTIECRGNNIREIEKKFNRLFNSEATLHALEVYSKFDGTDSSIDWFPINDLLAALAQTASINSLYKPSRAYKYLEAIATNESWRMDARKWAMDCLPPEWHRNYFGIRDTLQHQRNK